MTTHPDRGSPLISNGVGVISSDDLAGRLHLSDGTQPAIATPDTAYLPDAYVPRSPWRSASPEELGALARSSTGYPVRLLKLYERETIISLQPQIAALQKTPLLGGSIWETPFLQELRASIEQHGRCTSLVSYHGITADPVGLQTVSWDETARRYVGLHMDTWAAAEGRDETAPPPIRLSLNLGVEDRYFLFVNQPVQAMRRYLGQSEGGGPGKAQVAKAFMHRFPGYPVIRLTLRPGEAYAADTENMLHDGSSAHQTQPVLHTAVRGYFNFKL